MQYNHGGTLKRSVEAAIDSRFTSDASDRIIGDKAYDSDSLDERLLFERGIELIARTAERGEDNAPGIAERFAAISAVESRKALCLASELPASGCTLRLPC